MQDLFYAKFTSKRGGFEPCQGAWCPECYQLEDMGDHPIKGIEEEDGFVIEQDEKNRFMCARKGDSFVTMFQCEQCHFQNIKGKDPCMGTVDEKLLQYIRRANLDAFWSRESSTVNASQQELKRDIRLG